MKKLFLFIGTHTYIIMGVWPIIYLFFSIHPAIPAYLIIGCLWSKVPDYVCLPVGYTLYVSSRLALILYVIVTALFIMIQHIRKKHVSSSRILAIGGLCFLISAIFYREFQIPSVLQETFGISIPELFL